MKISLLAAVSVDGFIAESSDQLADWTSKEDKRSFVSKTKDAGVWVMGRKTYETIGKPLPGRLNVIMTRDPSKFEDIEGTLRYTSDAPKQIIETRRLITDLAGDHTIILSTHILPEVSQTCERVVIINNGRIVAVDQPDRLSARLRRSEKISVTVKAPPPDVAAMDAPLRARTRRWTPGWDRLGVHRS